MNEYITAFIYGIKIILNSDIKHLKKIIKITFKNLKINNLIIKPQFLILIHTLKIQLLYFVISI